MKKLFLLRLAIGITVIAALIWKVGVSKLHETATQANLVYLIPILALLLGILPLVRTYTYLVLLRVTKPAIQFRTVFLVNAYSWALGLFLPGGKLGEFSAIYFLKKEGATVEEASAAVLTDKLISFFVLSAFAAGGVAKFLSIGTSALIIGWLAALALGTFLGVYAALRTPLRHLIDKVLQHFHISLSEFVRMLGQYKREGKLQLFANFALTIVGAAISAALYSFAFSAFGASVNFLDIVFISSAAALAALLPISIGGLGVREMSAVVLFSQLGVSSAVVLSSHLLIAFLSYLVGAAILLVYVTRSKKL